MAWRGSYLIEYYPIQGYGPTMAEGGPRINDSPDNMFRALRVYNGTRDMVYAEVTELADWDFAAPKFYEVYDMAVDPYQLRNLHDATPPALLADLAAQLVALWGCVGEACP